MENFNSSGTRLRFWGEGGKLFGIYIVNLIFTILTLGLYYPWAKAQSLRYLYQETELQGSRFVFHGTGKEMFIGFIKALGIFLILWLILVTAIFSQNPVIMVVGMLFFYVALFLLIPVAIHGSYRYRMSRTSWRGIHWGYRGNLKTLLVKYVSGILLSIITLGIYSFWFAVDIRKYILNHIRFGNVSFSYTGTGGEYFAIVLKGWILTILTLGIYMFWYSKDIFNFYINHIKIHQDGEVYDLRSTATGGKFFELLIINFLIIIFTLGLGTPWVTVRTLKFVFENSVIDPAFDPEKIQQTEEAYKDATGDDLSEILDVGMI